MRATIEASIYQDDYEVYTPTNDLPGWIRRVLSELDILKKERDSAGE